MAGPGEGYSFFCSDRSDLGFQILTRSVRKLQAGGRQTCTETLLPPVVSGEVLDWLSRVFCTGCCAALCVGAFLTLKEKKPTRPCESMCNKELREKPSAQQNNHT